MSKDEYDLMVSEQIGLTFHMCRANSNDGAPPRAIIDPSGVHIVALVNSSLNPLVSTTGMTHAVFFRREMRPGPCIPMRFAILDEWTFI